MTPYVEEIANRIFQGNPPKPFDQKTPEEHQRDREKFLQTLKEMPAVTDEQIDEFFAAGRMDSLKLQIPDLTEEEAESA